MYPKGEIHEKKLYMISTTVKIIVNTKFTHNVLIKTVLIALSILRIKGIYLMKPDFCHKESMKDLAFWKPFDRTHKCLGPFQTPPHL